jgi:hypothetical protein
VLPDSWFDLKAPKPKAVLLRPIVFRDNALLPNAVLLVPVVMLAAAPTPFEVTTLALGPVPVLVWAMPVGMDANPTRPAPAMWMKAAGPLWSLLLVFM